MYFNYFYKIIKIYDSYITFIVFNLFLIEYGFCSCNFIHLIHIHILYTYM